MVRTFARSPADAPAATTAAKPAAAGGEKEKEKGGCPELPISYGFMVPVTITSHAYADCHLGGGTTPPDPKPPIHNPVPKPDPQCTTAQFHSWPLDYSAGKQTHQIIADGQCHPIEFDDLDGAHACEPGNNTIQLYGMKSRCGANDCKSKGVTCTEEFKMGSCDPCQSQDFKAGETQGHVYFYTATANPSKPGGAAAAPPAAEKK